jgi:S-adenosylmethionine decarboxylase
MLDFRGVPAELLRNVAEVRAVLYAAAEAGRCTVLGERFHQFSPEGVTGILLLAESHLSMHTWPERLACSLDAYTCGESVRMDALEESLLGSLRPLKVSRRFVVRS